MAPQKAPKAKVEPKAAAADESKKRKEVPAATAADEAPKKEAKTEAPADEKSKEEKAPAGPVEHEKDAPSEAKNKLQEPVVFRASDSTINTVSTLGGKVLMTLSEGGMQYLIAGARASVGLKAGRYLYEVKIVESLHNEDGKGGGKGSPASRQVLRIGFSTAGSSLVLGESSTEHVFFDSDGFFKGGGKQTPLATRFAKEQVLAVVLNLDSSSKNANTVSLFRDGERVSQPQALPESLHGKALYPHVAFRGVSVQVMTGPQPTKALPFKCLTVGGAEKEHTVAGSPASDKYEVVLPIAFPDEGTFEWLDGFLAKNPHFVELSDRMIQAWAASSGLSKPRPAAGSSNDKPSFNYGIPGMDDFSIRRVIYNIAPAVPRNYVIMEVKSNLTEADRAEVLKKFSSPVFKVTAKVVMGEPSGDYKKEQQSKLLKAKQAQLDMEFKVRKIEKERKKQLQERQKKIVELRKKAEEERKKAFDAAQKKKAEATAAAAGEAKTESTDGDVKMEGDETKPEEAKAAETAKEETKAETKEETKEGEAKDEDAEMKEESEEPEETEPAKAELTDDEKKLWFMPKTNAQPDLTPAVLNASFSKFSLPDKKEGFAEITFEWQKDGKSKEYLKKWVLEKKLTSRIDDLQPSQWFKEKHAEWTKLFQEWQTKQKAFKATPAGKKLEEKKPEGEEGDKAAEANVSGIEDVCDAGDGEPLFAKFAMEDWALLQLRFELYLLQRAFTLDVNDAERVGITDEHLAFYYNKYFRKVLNAKAFGVDSNVALAELVKDTVTVSGDKKVLTSSLSEDTDSLASLLKLTEEKRRERQRRIDAGDETAKLKFAPTALSQPAPAAAAAPAGGKATGKGWQPQSGGKSWGKGK